MKPAVFAFALLAALVMGAAARASEAAPAAATRWIEIRKVSDGAIYFDRLTVSGNAQAVRFRTEEDLNKDKRLGDKRYRAIRFYWRVPCSGDVADLTKLEYLDQSARLVSASDLDPPTHNSMSPESGLAIVRDYACRLIKHRASLKPHLINEIAADAEWISLRADRSDGNDVALSRASIRRQGDKARFITRFYYVDGRDSGVGYFYQTAYERFEINCSLSVFRNLADDYLDANSQLVDTVGDDIETSFFEAIPAGSIAERMKEIACRDDGQQQASRDDKAGAGSDPGADAEAGGGIGTGTAWLGPKGYLITASHVVHNADQILVTLGRDPVGQAEVVVDDPRNDVAILRPKWKVAPPVAIDFAASAAALGERVFTLGYPSPDVLGLAIKMTSGEVNAMSGTDPQSGMIDDARLLQMSVPVQPGNSGGPLLDEQGRAVGVVIARMDSNGDALLQNVNYAVKIAYVRSLLSELPDIGGYRPEKTSESLTALVGQLKGSVFMLVVKEAAPAK